MVPAGPLIGRESECALIDEALERVDHGRPAALVFAGPPGVGKSRLLGELTQASRRRGHLVLTGSGAELERDVPFGPVVAALDDYLASLGAARVERLCGDHGELATVFPSLNGGTALPPSPFERHRAYRAVAELLGALSRRAPVALVLDDAHWADPASVELLEHLARVPPEGPLLVATAHRPGQAPPRLLVALSQWAGTGAVVEVKPLGLREAEALAGMLGAEVGDAAALAARSEGNPLFLEHLVRGSGGASASEALQAELVGLDPDAARLLVGAAVAGDPFDLDLAVLVADLDEPAALDALDVLLANELLRETDTPRRFGFRHPLVRTAVYDELTEEDRRAGHAAAAGALAAAGAPATARAGHVARAALPGDGAAIALLTEAAAIALSRAPVTAAGWFDRALELLPEGTPRFGLLVPAALAHTASGEAEQGWTYLEAALAETGDDVPGRPLLVATAAQLDLLTGRHLGALSRLERELDALPDATGAEAVALMQLRASCGLYTGDFADGAAWAARALETARAGDSGRLALGHTLALDAMMRLQLGAGQEALPHIDAASAVFDEMPDTELVVNHEGVLYLGWAEHWAERHEDAARHLTRAIDLARATGRVVLIVPMLIGRAFASLALGRLDAARRDIDDATEVARALDVGQFIVWARVVATVLATAEEDHERAIALGRQAMKEAHEVEVRIMLSGAGWAYANALLAAGRPAKVDDVLLEAGGGPGLPIMEPGVRVACQVLSARAALQLGALDRAAAVVAEAGAAAAALGFTGTLGSVDLARAELLAAQGDHAGAAAAALASACACDRVGWRLPGARARTVAAVALRSVGDAEGAARELQHAYAGLVTAGAERAADAVATELRRGGAATAESAGAGTLSQRQREIAELVAAGKTNREIAAALHLSEKTIEGHLGRAYALLGVSSRSALAAAVSGAR